MRSRVRRFAHFLERTGLAMAGAASGLFVAVHVGSSVAALTSQIFLLVMMIAGAVGFYLGIDTPPQAIPDAGSSNSRAGERVDSAEFLSAIGTFLAALMAFISVGLIVLRENAHIVLTLVVMAGWVAGVTMQVVAGAITRMRA